MHLIINGIDTVYTPEGAYADTWHGLQTVLQGGIDLSGDNAPEVFHPIVAAGFKPDFNAEVSDAPAELAEYVQANPIAKWKVLLADLRKQSLGKVIPIHVAKSGYTVHQNRILFDAFVASAKQVCGEGFEIVTLGTLGGFSQFFVSIRIKGLSEFKVGSADQWTSFFNLISSHNALVASQIMLSMVRMVCMNTVLASIAEAGEAETVSKIRHSKNSLELITPEAFAANLQDWLDKRERTKALLEALQGEAMNLDGFRAFASGVFTRSDSDELSTTSFNRVSDMETLFAKGRGNNGASRYDALNAFTEYFTSGAGVGNAQRVAANKRIASANFGRGAEWKLEALRCLSTPEAFAETVQRGERFYTDKLKLVATSN